MADVLSEKSPDAVILSGQTELQKLTDFIEREKQNGLKDVKFFPGETSNATVESFAGEVNSLLNGVEVSIEDLI